MIFMQVIKGAAVWVGLLVYEFATYYGLTASSSEGISMAVDAA